ncbi:MAG: choice-of-anchor J domain-containing protein [Muribaculaceae bacterium]|nr:choice-of-anchor J domain-containing protein [Muribaculaceae bacterium]
MKQCITKFLMLTVMGGAALTAYGDAALTIDAASWTPASGDLYANSDNIIAGQSMTVTLTNSGDTDLSPGNENFSVTILGRTGIPMLTLDLDKPMAAGQTETFSFENFDLSIQPLIDDAPGSTEFWSNVSLRENVSGTSKSNVRSWATLYTYSVNYNLVGESSGVEIDKPINFGFVTEATTLKYRLRATGGADVVVTDVEMPDGFSLSNVQCPFTVKGLANKKADGDEYQPLEITFTPTQPGAKAGPMKFIVEGGASKEYQLSAAFVGPDSFFESFDGEGGYDYLPQGWVLGDNWRIYYKYMDTSDSYALQHTSADGSSFAITPKLKFNEGDALTFQAAKRSYSSELKVYCSTDRVNWTLLKNIQSSYGSDAETFPPTNDLYGDFVVDNLPEGELYIGFEGKYVWLNNVFGGEVAAVDHDLIIAGADVPAKATVNNAWHMTFSVKNLLAQAEAAGSYSVELVDNGETVATIAETPAIDGGATVEFGFDHVFHQPGEHTVFARVTVGETVLTTPETVVTVKAESSDEVLTVGVASGATSGNMPLTTNYNNSESQVIYTEAYLAKFGIKPGTSLTGIVVDAKSSSWGSAKQIPNTLTIWLKKVEESTISDDGAYDMSDCTPLVRDENGLLDIKTDVGDYELINEDFAAPYVYEGGNLLMVFRSEASDYKSNDFYYDAELKDNAIAKYKDNHDDFLTASWYAKTGTPVVKFKVYSQPAQLAGTVKNAQGEALAGVALELVSGDVVYTGVTDANGGYKIEVFQPALTYTLTVDDENYPVYTAEVSFADGDPAGDIVMGEFSTSRDYPLTVKVTNNAGVSLEGETFTLVSERFAINYPVSECQLDSNGEVTLNVYGGRHSLTVAVKGMKPVTMDFAVNKAKTVEVALEEDVQQPYGTSYNLHHDIFTGENTVTLNWNGDEAVFEDDFESHEAFAVNFAPWTGIDVDNSPAAAMSGSYPHRGEVNYGQIINPMAVDPIWDPAMYPTLVARSGMQYVGFVQTSSGVANNDWLITPAIELGEDNVVRFSVKSADQGNARFTVGITTAENPAVSDFTIISEGNYIEADYTGWKTVEISLAKYAGETVKIGFHCISQTGAFISQLDDVFVGRVARKSGVKALRVAPRSAANPNEKFVVMLDGEKVGETEDYSFTLAGVQPGKHVAQIIATYLQATAEPVEIEFEINADDYVKADFAVTTNNDVVPAEMNVVLTSKDDADAVYGISLTDGAASVASLPKGLYNVALAQEFYNAYSEDVEINGAMTVTIALEETVVKPFNLVHESVVTDNGEDVTVSWNRNYGFNDSFESYDDFATGEFGGWQTVNNNETASYPIGLGSMTNIVTFPGASTPQVLASVPPMVFNPHQTVPAMTADVAVHALTGDKSVIFMGPQQSVADKWLISPQLTVREGYEMSVAAKAYSIYPETIELCISTTGNEPSDFEVLDAVQPGYSQWTQYAVSLAAYEGQDVYVAIHCTSYDGFLVQIDDFKFGREGGEEISSVGYVKSYDVTLNDEAKGNTTETEMTFPGLTEGNYKVGVRANYVSGASEYAFYEFEVEKHSGLENVAMGGLTVKGGAGEILISGCDADVVVFNTAGVAVAAKAVSGSASVAVAPGVYVVNAGGVISKVTVK